MKETFINTVDKNSIKDYIASDDPLSDDAVEFLINYQEEDTFVDYKVSFDNEEREWLEITKDILAFTNTFGGYLVFGIKDATYEEVGLSENILKIVSDINNIMQKVNRSIEPHIQLLRCKPFKKDEKDFLIIFIPPSLDKTHMISRTSSFKHPSGKDKTVLYVGTTYIRRSAGNHMMDSRDIDDVVNRRLNYFKDSLLDKIARVVESPQQSEVFIVTEAQEDGEHTKFIVNDAPDAIPVKGMSFTVAPETIEQEIMGWIAMTSRDQEAIPSSSITWKWYKERKILELTNKQKLEVAKYCILTEVPAFFWLEGCDALSVKTMLLEILSRHINVKIIGDVISTGAFLGNKFHKDLITKIGAYAERIAPIKKTIPVSGPKTFFSAEKLKIKKGEYEKIEAELDAIAASAENNNNHIPPLALRWRAQTLDCFLYAKEDQYIGKRVK